MRHSLKFLVVCFLPCVLFFCLPDSVSAAAGDLDTTYGLTGKVMTDFAGRGGVAYATTIQSDRKIVVGGTAFTGDNFFDADFALVRYNLDGSLDTSFGVGGKVLTDFAANQDEIHDLAIQADGKIVAVGRVRDNTGIHFGLARYNPNGTLDSTFGTGGKVVASVASIHSDANAVLIQPDHRIVVAGRGNAASSPTNVNFTLARFNPNGTLDTTFGSSGIVVTDMGGPFDLVNDLTQQPDGKIIAAGYKGSDTDRDNYALARYNSDGTLDDMFGSGGKVETDFLHFDDRGRSVALQADGKIVVAGGVRPEAGGERHFFGIARYKTDGTLDGDFNSTGKVTTDFAAYSPVFAENFAVVVQPDQKIISVGWMNHGFTLARYNPGGALDNTFGIQGTRLIATPGPLFAAVLQPDGKLFVAGGNGSGGFSTARFLTSTTDAPILQIVANSANALAIDSVHFTQAPFSITNDLNFSADHRTRIILFAANLTLANGENASSVTVQAQTSGGTIVSLPVEYVGVVPNCEWFTQVVVRLPDALANVGAVQVSITHGNTSNQGSVVIN